MCLLANGLDHVADLVSHRFFQFRRRRFPIQVFLRQLRLALKTTHTHGKTRPGRQQPSPTLAEHHQRRRSSRCGTCFTAATRAPTVPLCSGVLFHTIWWNQTFLRSLAASIESTDAQPSFSVRNHQRVPEVLSPGVKARRAVCDVEVATPFARDFNPSLALRFPTTTATEGSMIPFWFHNCPSSTLSTVSTIC